MNSTRSSDVVAVLTVGVFASVLFGVAIAVSPSLAILDGGTYTAVKQAQIRVLQVAMTIISSVYTMAAIVILYQERRAKGAARFRLTLIALVLIVAALIYSGPTDIAYNQQILSWTPATPPADWASVRDAWDFSNRARTVPSMIAFLLQALALTAPRSPA